MMDDACTLTHVTGPPYQIDDGLERWLVFIRGSSQSLGGLVNQVAELIAPRPCAAELRVYGEVANSAHVFHLPSAAEAIPLLDRCEAVGVFDSGDVGRDQQSFLCIRNDPSGPDWDETCILQAIQPRPALFLRAGHRDIAVVCGRSDAESLLRYLRKRE